MKSKKTKVAIIANIPSPYRVDFYNTLNSKNELEFKVYFLAESESNRNWTGALKRARFPYEISRGIHAFSSRKEWPIHLNMGVFFRLLRYSPDVIITTGYDSPGYWMAMSYAKMLRRPLITWYGSTKNDQMSTGGAIEKLRSFYLSNTAAFFTYGEAATESLVSRGVSSDRIVTGLNTVDMNSINENVLMAQKKPSYQSDREKYPKFLFLYAGQFITRKRVDLLLQAYAEIQDADVGLILAGSGPEEDALKHQAAELGLTNIWFQPFRQYDDMPELYALADCLVLPSDREVWGLVVNEALAAGMYSIIADKSGCSKQLVENPIMGRKFSTGSVQSLVEAMENTKLNGDHHKQQRSQRATTAARDFSLDKYVAALTQAVNKVAK
jgi:glycosyltransferase involved in cell wall biosynthesis